MLTVAASLASQNQQAREGRSDLVQESLVVALGLIDQGRGPAPTEQDCKAWLADIMKKTAMKRRTYNLAQLRSLQREQGRREFVEVQNDSSTPSSRAYRNEELDQLEQARRHLDAREQLIIDMRTVEQLSFDEIGQRLGISGVAAHKAFHRTLQKLAKHYRQTSQDAWLNRDNAC